MSTSRVRSSSSPSVLHVPCAPLRPPDSYRRTAHPETVGYLHEPAPDAHHVPEALVQDLWRRQAFDTQEMTTTDGRPLVVVHPGRHNTDAGPDFSNAHLRIGDVQWRGDVEIHTRSATWFEHRHHTDPRYDRVVLHVTLHADVWTGALTRSDGSTVPEVVLYPRLNASLRELLRDFYTRSDPDELPCTSKWETVDAGVRADWIRRLGRQRLLQKRNRLRRRRGDDLTTLLHRCLFAGLGYAKNTQPMTMLAERVPYDRIRALETAVDREALHFGAAGLLPSPKDLLDADRETADYVMMLRRRFEHHLVRAPVPPMASTAWTFFRMRPNNFPPLRIAQATAWWEPGGVLADRPLEQLHDALDEASPAARFRELLRRPLPDFWWRHYRLRTSTKERDPRLGRTRADTLIVNAILPVLLLDAHRSERPSLQARVLELAATLPASTDTVTRRFAAVGTRPKNALDVQGLHRLYRDFCRKGGCLQCDVGTAILDLDGQAGPDGA